MPSGSLFRIPTSLSRDGDCKTNLRGVNATSPVDYIDIARVFTANNIQSVNSNSKANVGGWANTIPKAFEATSVDNDPLIQYPSLLSTSRRGTLLFRLYVKTKPEGSSVVPVQCVFLNGSADGAGGGTGYGVFVQTDASGENPNVIFNLFGIDPSGNIIAVQLNQAPLVLDTWYTYGVQFETVNKLAGMGGEEGGGEGGGAAIGGGGGGGAQTLVTAYENGRLLFQNQAMGEMVTPSGGTYIFSYPPLGAPFYGGITDFAVIEVGLGNIEAGAFGEAPYI
jgi:hypothetical protein